MTDGKRPKEDPAIVPPGVGNTIQQALLAWFPEVRRDLPWRRGTDPYKVWISEIMLQQTQVKTVLPYFQRFCRVFPSVSDLARADLQSVLKLWQGLGYYSRARNMHRCAGIIDQKFAGRIPDSWQQLRQLPGVGDYTAAAVLSIAYAQPYAVVDGNVKRVLSRLFLLPMPVNQANAHKYYQAVADQLLAVHAPGDYNQAIMELGALVCTPKSPDCSRCPLKSCCRAHRRHATDKYPVRIKSTPVPRHLWVSTVIRKNGRILMVQRPAEGLLGGLWEFPCYNAASGEDPIKAAHRRLYAMLGIETAVLSKLVRVTHAYTHFKIRMDVYLCDWVKGRLKLDGPSAGRWVQPHRIESLPIHRAVQKALGGILQALTGSTA